MSHVEVIGCVCTHRKMEAPDSWCAAGSPYLSCRRDYYMRVNAPHSIRRKARFCDDQGILAKGYGLIIMCNLLNSHLQAPVLLSRLARDAPPYLRLGNNVRDLVIRREVQVDSDSEDLHCG